MRTQQKNKKTQGSDRCCEDEPARKSDEYDVTKTEIKDAHAAGMGALGKSDDNQIEKLTVDEKNEDVY